MEVLRLALTSGFSTRLDLQLWEADLVYSFSTDERFTAKPSSFRWFAQKNRNFWYAFGTSIIDGRQRLIALHRLLSQAPAALHVDHRNTDTLDNVLTNLRVCTHSQNQANRQAMGGRSKFKGVCGGSGSRRKPWRAQIQQKRDDGTFKRACLGLFETEEEAARAYDAAALEKYGEFALLNFPAKQGG